MNKLKTREKDKVRNFVQWTNCAERVAIGCLQVCYVTIYDYNYFIDG